MPPSPAAPRSWLDPRLLVPVGIQTLILIVVGAQWKATVDESLRSLASNQARLETSQTAMGLTLGDHTGRIVRVETQVISIQRIEEKMDRLLRFIPPDQRGSMAVPGWIEPSAAP